MEKYFVKLAQISIGIFLFAILSTQILSFKSALADDSANKFSNTTKQSLISGCTVDFPNMSRQLMANKVLINKFFKPVPAYLIIYKLHLRSLALCHLRMEIGNYWRKSCMQDSTQLTAITDTQKRSLIQIYSVGYILVMGNSNVVACTKKAEQQ